ncbi:hypothetical protein KI387_024380, partial [Taxus chinensis]
RHPKSKEEAERTTTPPHPQERDDEDVNATQGEHMFKSIFRRTRTQGATPTTVHKSPRISPQKEATTQRRRKLKLSEEAEESMESVPNSPTFPENKKEQGEASKEKEEEEERPEEIAVEY